MSFMKFRPHPHFSVLSYCSSFPCCRGKVSSLHSQPDAAIRPNHVGTAPRIRKLHSIQITQSEIWKSVYGTYIIAKQLEKPGLVFEFHHMVHGSLLVKAGDTVAAGTPLGIEGTTGNSTGVHLHFQLAKKMRQ